MTFDAAHPALARALADRGYASPTPVQAAVLDAPPDRDLLVSAQTGSGKTVAFGLAFARNLLGDAERFDRPGAPLALVVAPTRELAQQVQRELEWLFGPSGGRVVACVGGMDPRREARALEGGAHVVVGTPGRLCDHLERGRLDLSAIRALVLDEADEMLDLGFRDELERLLDTTPPERRTLLFSATVPAGIESLAARYQRDALRIATATKDEPHGDIAYRAVVVAPNEREHAVVNILRHLDAPGALVFCTTREAVNHLHGNLLERGFAVVSLSGELTQAERNRALQSLRDGRARVCVATDVAARGLDLPDLGLVIHADLPREPATLLHRSGRTGRAGRKGTAVLIVPFNRRRAAERLMAMARVEPHWSDPPTAEQVRALDDERLFAELSAPGEEPAEEDLAVAKRLLAQKDGEVLAATLVRMLRARLPAPEEISVAPPPRPAAERPPRLDRLDRAERPQREPRAYAPREEARAYARRDEGEFPPERRVAPRAHVPHEGGSEGAWFRINVGREENADPRWLVPLLCRRGHIGKQEIGLIRVLRHETRVEIDPRVADRFAAAAGRPDHADPHIRIVPLGVEGTAPPRRPRPHRG